MNGFKLLDEERRVVKVGCMRLKLVSSARKEHREKKRRGVRSEVTARSSSHNFRDKKSPSYGQNWNLSKDNGRPKLSLLLSSVPRRGSVFPRRYRYPRRPYAAALIRFAIR